MAPSPKFTVEEEVFIVEKYVQGLTDIEVKRAVRKKFGQSRNFSNAEPHHYRRVYARFQKKGKKFTASILPNLFLSFLFYILVQHFLT